MYRPVQEVNNADMAIKNNCCTKNLFFDRFFIFYPMHKDTTLVKVFK